MKLYKMFFSPTGGTKKAADIVSGVWDCKIIDVDLCDADCDFSQYKPEMDDVCIAAVPAYGGRVPEPALSRIREIDGGNAKTILMAVYGNRHYDDTFLELKNTLIMAGFQCVAAIAAVAEHSIVRQYAAGRPDKRDQVQLIEFSEKIKKAWKRNQLPKSVDVPGKEPYREYHGVPLKPKGNRKCDQCGLCVVQCPVKAIPEENPSNIKESQCISCMRCVAVCPNHARDLNKVMIMATAKKIKKACQDRKENELFL